MSKLLFFLFVICSMGQSSQGRVYNRKLVKLFVNTGAGNLTTIQEAIDAVPENNNRPYIIMVKPGTYKEKVIIPQNKPFITLQGCGKETTTITWNQNAKAVGGTYSSASVAVEADDFTAYNISFENAAPWPTPGASEMQAVALRISGDRAAFFGCGFYGAQDTLYDHKGRHYFKDCFIQGSVDFVFGNGRSLYQDCHLHSIANSFGSVTAQNRWSEIESSGFSFVNCKITGGSGQLYLGRAWGAYSRVVFAFTYMDKIINPEGWDDWNDPKRRRTAFYGQYKCTGPGSDVKQRVEWSRSLSPQQAAPFLTLNYIDGTNWVNHSLHDFESLEE